LLPCSEPFAASRAENASGLTMYFTRRIRSGMPCDAASAAAEFAQAFPAVFLRFHVRRAKRSELSARARGLLEHLALSGPLTVTEAARHMNRAQSAMSEMLLALERQHWLTRFPDARDRRRTLVWLTEAGQQRLAADRRVLDTERLSLALAGMSPSERKQLLVGMRALLRSAESLRPISSSAKNSRENSHARTSL
jgi:DNA-binding MarR family transcriptional regulator